jgi:hypothetical protein
MQQRRRGWRWASDGGIAGGPGTASSGGAGGSSPGNFGGGGGGAAAMATDRQRRGGGGSSFGPTGSVFTTATTAPSVVISYTGIGLGRPVERSLQFSD